MGRPSGKGWLEEGGHKTCLWGGRVGLGGRRPDPGLLVPDASRQEAEANFIERCILKLDVSKKVASLKYIELLNFTACAHHLVQAGASGIADPESLGT